MSRIAPRFAALKFTQRKGFIPFITAADPDLETCAQILSHLPKAGCDLIEIGMPFSDPMADGPAIERANLRAFAAGVTMDKILAMVADFRKLDNETPIILMGYANPLYAYGLQNLARDAKNSGVDGLIVADLPPEEDAELRILTDAQNIDLIRLIAPTTDAARLSIILNGASGFLYYVSVTGITGGKQASADNIASAIEKIRIHTNLPVGVGFGISTPEQAHDIAKFADAVIVGSAIVNRIASHLDAEGKPNPGLVKDVLSFIETLAKATHKG